MNFLAIHSFAPERFRGFKVGTEFFVDFLIWLFQDSKPHGGFSFNCLIEFHKAICPLTNNVLSLETISFIHFSEISRLNTIQEKVSHRRMIKFYKKCYYLKIDSTYTSDLSNFVPTCQTNLEYWLSLVKN